MQRVLYILFIIFLSINTFSQPPTGNEQNFTKRTFIYKTIGEIPIQADLYQAINDSTLRPGIVWIHGGGLIFGGREDLPEEQRNFYLKAGYSIVSIDYRLAPKTKLPEIVNDVKDAIEWVRQNGSHLLRIDSSQIFVIGHSGGAYLALIAGYILPNPPRAIVSFYGYGDIQGEWYNKPDSFYRTMPAISDDRAAKLIYDSAITSASFNDRFDLYIYTRQKGSWPFIVSGHDPQKEKEWFDRFLPIKNITANYPPVLLIHGDKDTDVPFEQALLLDRELQLKNVKHKFIRLKNYGHVFDLLEGGLSNPDIYNVFIEVKDFLNSFRQ